MFNFFETLDPKTVKGVTIHPTAQVAKTAKLGTNVFVGAGAVIGPQVELHDGVKIGHGAIVEGKTTVGTMTEVYPFATLGSPPQDLKYAGEPTELVIGRGNKIREYVNISIGTEGGGGRTVVGNNNLIMIYSHIAHDCRIGSDCIFANGVQLAGHVTVKDRVVFGGMSGGHQFCSFGEYAMVAAGAIVVQDVPPYAMVQGDRARIIGLNVVGLRRAGIRGESMDEIKKMFRLLLQENLTLEQAVHRITEEINASAHKTSLLEFLAHSERGICR